MIRTSQEIRTRAKELRRDETPAERRLWSGLRGRRLSGFKFRRQHPVGRYIADFYCPACRLVVELDGAIHQVPTEKLRDRYRDEWLEENGYVVLRFSNREVKEDLGAVLYQIESVCRRLVPSPIGWERADRSRSG